MQVNVSVISSGASNVSAESAFQWLPEVAFQLDAFQIFLADPPQANVSIVEVRPNPTAVSVEAPTTTQANVSVIEIKN